MKPPYKPVVETHRLAVRVANESDIEMICKLWGDPRVMVNVGFPWGIAVNRDDLLEQLSQQVENPPVDALLVIELKLTGELIGECKLGAPDEEGIAETDIKLLPEHWGQKYGVELKRALVDYLFRHTACTAVQATPNVTNTASIKMQEAVGGVRTGEGVFEFPEHMRDFTTPVHHYVYRVYRKDWQS